MNEIDEATLCETIQAAHGAKARLVRRIRVLEDFDGEPLWDAEVLLFALFGHPATRWCYAWEVDGEVTTVLQVPPVRTASDAVCAAIVSEADEAV